jgi:hypothetical protein
MREETASAESHKLCFAGATPTPATILRRYTAKEVGLPVKQTRFPLAWSVTRTPHHFSCKLKKPKRPAATRSLVGASPAQESTFKRPRSSIDKERRTSNAGDPGGRPGGGATFWGRMFCRSEPVLQTSCCECDSHRLHHSRVAQQTEQQLAKLKAAGVIPAVGTILWMVKHCVAVPCLENR